MAPLGMIFGCGYLGRRVARRWLAAGTRVAALTRGNASLLARENIEPLEGDILDPASLRDLPRAETVLYAVGWDRASGRSKRAVYVEGLANVLAALPPPARFIHISSTSVYGQAHGDWVDETSPTTPHEESGQVVLDAERLLREKRPDAIILRFAGIYGPDRLSRIPALMAGAPLVGDADRWLNLIHIEDGVEAVLAAEARGEPGTVYNITDNEPTTRRTFYTHLAALLRAPLAQFDDRQEPDHPNRRVSNTRAKTALHWQPRYPSYREGLAANFASEA